MCFATSGRGSGDEARITSLLSDFDVYVYPFDRTRKARNVLRIVLLMRKRRPALVVMEGTGVAGGISVLVGQRLFGVPYLVSSGDAVGPFVGGIRRAAAFPAWIYEFVLYRRSAGFIGWTPYLVGRALTMGAPRAVTAANFVAYPEIRQTRRVVRERLGIPEKMIVFGIVGSLVWNRRCGYCYGMELVEAIRQVQRRDVAVLIVGEGTGRERLADRAGSELGQRIFLPGAVPRDLVTSYLAAMDVGSLPQSVDQVGSFRYTTKLSEDQSVRLPIVTGQIPMAYDLVSEWSWRLPGRSPWSGTYVDALAALMRSIDHDEIAAIKARVPESIDAFDQAAQRRRVGMFVSDTLNAADEDSRS